MNSHRRRSAFRRLSTARGDVSRRVEEVSPSPLRVAIHLRCKPTCRPRPRHANVTYAVLHAPFLSQAVRPPRGQQCRRCWGRGDSAAGRVASMRPGPSDASVLACSRSRPPTHSASTCAQASITVDTSGARKARSRHRSDDKARSPPHRRTNSAYDPAVTPPRRGQASSPAQVSANWATRLVRFTWGLFIRPIKWLWKFTFQRWWNFLLSIPAIAALFAGIGAITVADLGVIIGVTVLLGIRAGLAELLKTVHRPRR